MIALIEEAACICLKGKLPEGKTSVGTDLSIKHLKPTPVGMNATAKVTIENTEKGDRLLTFKVEVFDDKEMIGKGTHQRFVVTEKSFFRAAYSKLEKPKI
jgi:fluoroacetyl-CoA thioesterase